MAVMTKALFGSCSFQVAGEHVLYAVSEDDISGLGTATVKNVWSVNVIVRRGHFVDCYKHVLIVPPMKKGTYRKLNSEMMKEENGYR